MPTLEGAMAVLCTGCGLNGEQHEPAGPGLLWERGTSPAIEHTTSMHIQVYLLMHSNSIWRRPVSSTCPTSCKLRLHSSEPRTSTARAQNWCLNRHNNPTVLPKFLQLAVYSYLYNKYRKLFPNIFNSVSEGL